MAKTGGLRQIRGVHWFSERDYPECRESMADCELLPFSYSDWLSQAEQDVRDLETEGHEVLKVLIDPKTFPAWCRARMLVRDHKARVRYANMVAFQKSIRLL